MLKIVKFDVQISLNFKIFYKFLRILYLFPKFNLSDNVFNSSKYNLSFIFVMQFDVNFPNLRNSYIILLRIQGLFLLYAKIHSIHTMSKLKILLL